MRISDWSSDVCSSDLQFGAIGALDCLHLETKHPIAAIDIHKSSISDKLRPQLLKKLGRGDSWVLGDDRSSQRYGALLERPDIAAVSMFGECFAAKGPVSRSEEHTSEIQSLMRISYAVFCLKKKNKQQKN